MPKRALLAALCVVAAASAQEPLSLRDAVGQALHTHAALTAGSERVAASAALRDQAALRLNPRAFFQAENLRSGGEPAFDFSQHADTYGYFSQTLETAGKRARRIGLAEANARRSEFELELTRQQIAYRVKAAYWQAVVAQKSQAILRESANTFQQIVAYHEARVREGAMAEADLLRVRLESERIEIAMNTAQLDADRARIQLFREMGRTEFPEVRFTDELDVTGPPPEGDVASALRNRPELRIAGAAVRQAEAAVGLQQSLARPNVDLVLGYKRTSGFNTMIGGVQTDLPFANRNQGNIAAADRSVRAAQADLAAGQALVRAEVAAAQREYEIRRREALDLLPPLRERAAESSRIALAAYREGGADLLRLLDAERVRLETEQLYYRTLADFQLSRVALETAMGVQP